MSADDLAARLRAAGCVFAEEEAALLLDEAADAVVLERMVARRVAGEPLETILGWVGFDGLRIAVAPGVFVPRRRSELLVREAVRRAAAGALVVELCCGVAAVAAAIAHRRPDVEVLAADVDAAAVALARDNLGPDRVFAGDLFTALPTDVRGRIDVLVANAPYVPTAKITMMPPEARDHEPLVALDGGADGLDVHRRIAAGLTTWLAPAGVVVIEASVAQAPVLASILTGVGCVGTEVRRDEDLDGTVVAGWLGPTN